MPGSTRERNLVGAVPLLQGNGPEDAATGDPSRHEHAGEVEMGRCCCWWRGDGSRSLLSSRSTARAMAMPRPDEGKGPCCRGHHRRGMGKTSRNLFHWRSRRDAASRGCCHRAPWRAPQPGGAVAAALAEPATVGELERGARSTRVGEAGL